MTLDPRWSIGLALFLALLGYLAGVGSLLSDALGLDPLTAKRITSIIVLLLGAGNTVNAVLTGIPSKNSTTGFIVSAPSPANIVKSIAILIAVSSMLLTMTACAEIDNVANLVTGATVTPSQAIIVANGFDAVEATADNYDALPACATGGPLLCRRASVVSAVDKAVRAGRKARDNLIAAITASNGSPVSASLLTALTDQESTIQAIIAGASQ